MDNISFLNSSGQHRSIQGKGQKGHGKGTAFVGGQEQSVMSFNRNISKTQRLGKNVTHLVEERMIMIRGVPCVNMKNIPMGGEHHWDPMLGNHARRNDNALFGVHFKMILTPSTTLMKPVMQPTSRQQRVKNNASSGVHNPISFLLVFIALNKQGHVVTKFIVTPYAGLTFQNHVSVTGMHHLIF
jgi:hypothetical protein